MGLFKQHCLAHGSAVCRALLGDCYRSICALAEKILVNVENKKPQTLIALFTASIFIWRIACEHNTKMRAGNGQIGNSISTFISVEEDSRLDSWDNSEWRQRNTPASFTFHAFYSTTPITPPLSVLPSFSSEVCSFYTKSKIFIVTDTCDYVCVCTV